jgi:hypothetical protein
MVDEINAENEAMKEVATNNKAMFINLDRHNQQLN